MSSHVFVLPPSAGTEHAMSPDDGKVAHEAFQIVRRAGSRREERETWLRRQFGLCAQCAHFEQRTESEHGNTETFAYCTAWRVVRPQGRTVQECSQFAARGQIPLALMLEMALPIGEKGVPADEALTRADQLREITRGNYL